MATTQFREQQPEHVYAGQRMRGYHPAMRITKRPSGGRASNLDAFYAVQDGVASTYAEEAARDLNRVGMRTGFGGVGVEPDRNMSEREKIKMGLNRATSAAPATSPPADVGAIGPYGDARPSSQTAAPATAALQPRVDPSTVRQPVGPLDPMSTPAQFRQMAGDAAVGRSVTTSGATGMTPGLSDPNADEMAPGGGRPMQAADFRRTISSNYGTGSNVTRTPGTPSATTVDAMGRTVPLREYLQNRKDIQTSKGQIAEDDPDNQEEDDQEEGKA